MMKCDVQRHQQLNCFQDSTPWLPMSMYTTRLCKTYRLFQSCLQFYTYYSSCFITQRTLTQPAQHIVTFAVLAATSCNQVYSKSDNVLCCASCYKLKSSLPQSEDDALHASDAPHGGILHCAKLRRQDSPGKSVRTFGHACILLVAMYGLQSKHFVPLRSWARRIKLILI